MTNSLLPPDFLQQIQDQATSFAAEILKLIIGMIWVSLRPYWPYLVISFFILLIILTVRAMLGEWGALGSLLYHIFYFGFLGIFIVIKGWEILFNPFFDLASFVVYRVAYMLTGLILSKFRNTF